MINGGNTEIIKSKLQQLVEDNDSNNFNNHIKAIIEALDSGEDFSKNYKNEKNKFISDNRYYKKQYSSFLTSLHFISSRIPAQSLQSFMPMKCVAWTQGSNNTAYVSHIQTYLQGSDY
jgi:hypothetical protein